MIPLHLKEALIISMIFSSKRSLLRLTIRLRNFRQDRFPPERESSSSACHSSTSRHLSNNSIKQSLEYPYNITYKTTPFKQDNMNPLFIALFALLAAYAYAGTTMKEGLNSTASTCGGNCPGNDCPSCPCGTSKNSLDIASWCAKYSWNQVISLYLLILRKKLTLADVYRLTASASFLTNPVEMVTL